MSQGIIIIVIFNRYSTETLDTLKKINLLHKNCKIMPNSNFNVLNLFNAQVEKGIHYKLFL